MATPRIVGLKTMHIAIRRLQLENGTRTVLSQKNNKFSTQQKTSRPTESQRPTAEEKSGGGGALKVVLTAAVAAGGGGVAYYYLNSDKERDPFTWVKEQLPFTKKKTETKPAVFETGGFKIKNNANQVECAAPPPEKSGLDSRKQTEKSVPSHVNAKPKPTEAKKVEEISTSKAPDPPLPTTTQITSAAEPIEVKDPKVDGVVATPLDVPVSKPKEPDSSAANAEAIASLQRQMAELKEAYEAEIHKALTRQAHVYQETYEHSKNVLKSEFDRRVRRDNEISEAEHLVELRAKYGQATAALSAMENALKGRQQQEVLSERSRKLWTLCNLMYNCINYQRNDSRNKTAVTKQSLLKEFSDDLFVVQLLQTFPNEVVSTESLRIRFFDAVDSNCRKVALFKNGESITLWKYFLGSVQESLVTKCEGRSETVKTPFEILDRTAFHLKRGELTEAVCTLNKIDGLPREVCRDWLADARAVLEANQTLVALMAYAMANNTFI